MLLLKNLNSKMIVVPVHQFEIRYTGILNFASVVRSVVAPFVKLADRVMVENENLHSERITLYFDEEYYHIIILWDRMVFRCERMNMSNFIHSNSVIEEPFLNLFKKISNLPEFGNVNHLILFSFYVKTEKENTLEDIRKRFIKENFASHSLSDLMIAKNLNDVGFVLESNDDEGSYIIQTGPYVGYEDIKKRNFTLRNEELISELQNPGEIIDLKYFKPTKTANFSSYKEMFKKADSIVHARWKN